MNNIWKKKSRVKEKFTSGRRKGHCFYCTGQAVCSKAENASTTSESPHRTEPLQEPAQRLL